MDLMLWQRGRSSSPARPARDGAAMAPRQIQGAVAAGHANPAGNQVQRRLEKRRPGGVDPDIQAATTQP